MPSLSDKLKSLGVRTGAGDLQRPKKRSGKPIEQVVSGELWDTPQGEAFVVAELYPVSFQQGNTTLLGESPLDVLAAWAREPAVAELSPQSFAFLDTETTGLAGGAGTFAFMIGVGRFEGETFHLAQFFMRDPAEEGAQLAALEQFLVPCEALVTFNGKAFDVPLLNNRYILHGWPSPLNSTANLDLLHLARRLWHDRLPSRTLGNLEVEILEKERTTADVPGWMIPEMYTDYLRSGDAEPLEGIFHHNTMDILSMAALLNYMASMLAEPLVAVEHNLDLLAIGKLHEHLGYHEKAISLYKHCLGRPLAEKPWSEVVRRLSFLFKRQENLSAAMELWRVAAKKGEIYAHVELAKVYEHQQRNFEDALEWTHEALAVVNAPGFPVFERFQWKGELEHRLERLERKKTRKE